MRLALDFLASAALGLAIASTASSGGVVTLALDDGGSACGAQPETGAPPPLATLGSDRDESPEPAPCFALLVAPPRMRSDERALAAFSADTPRDDPFTGSAANPNGPPFFLHAEPAADGVEDDLSFDVEDLVAPRGPYAGEALARWIEELVCTDPVGELAYAAGKLTGRVSLSDEVRVQGFLAAQRARFAPAIDEPVERFETERAAVTVYLVPSNWSPPEPPELAEEYEVTIEAAGSPLGQSGR